MISNIKISIITVSFQSGATIEQTIQSVLSQTYSNIEYLIIDGASKDNTLQIIEKYKNRISHIVSEPDKGIYNAMNKGIKLATGEIIGILNSDDFFCNNQIIENVVNAFSIQQIDALYGDVQFIDPIQPQKITRYYSSKRFKPFMFKYGFMPAHPSFYAKRELFEKYGLYKEDYKIASDYELLIRFLYVNKIKTTYLNFPFVTMQMGGVSTKSFRSNIILNQEIVRGCKENNLYTNLFFVYLKYFIKIFELIKHKN